MNIQSQQTFQQGYFKPVFDAWFLTYAAFCWKQSLYFCLYYKISALERRNIQKVRGHFFDVLIWINRMSWSISIRGRKKESNRKPIYYCFAPWPYTQQNYTRVMNGICSSSNRSFFFFLHNSRVNNGRQSTSCRICINYWQWHSATQKIPPQGGRLQNPHFLILSYHAFFSQSEISFFSDTQEARILFL